MYLVGADLTQEQHEALVSNIDVLAVPENLDNNVSAIALSTVRDVLEGFNIPGNLVTTAWTYRQVVRLSLVMCKFMTCYYAIYHAEPAFGGGITLNTTWAQLPAVAKTRISTPAQSFTVQNDGFVLDASAVTAQTTMRQLLAMIYNQWPQCDFAGEVF